MDGWISNILSVFLFLEIDVNIYFQSILWMLMKQDRFWVFWKSRSKNEGGVLVKGGLLDNEYPWLVQSYQHV